MLRRFANPPVLARIFVIVGAGLAITATVPAVASARTVFTGSATGTVITISGNSFTIQTAGRRIGVVNALTAAANRITRRDYPYVYGGGHAQAGIASIGIKGPGYNGHRLGFDCSGSVAAVLSAAGLWPAGGGVPNDAGMIAMLRREGLIARGVGSGPVGVTLYDDPGIHIFMNIDGRFFGTSDGGGGGDPRGGAGWLDDGAPDASSRTYKPYHFLRPVLRASTSSGHILSFQVGALGTALAGLALGDKVHVTYRESSSGAMLATTVAFPGALSTSGTVEAVAPDGSSFTIQTAGGPSVTFVTANNPTLTGGLVVGDTVQVTYTTTGGTPTARAVEIMATSAGSAAGNGGNPGAGWTPGG